MRKRLITIQNDESLFVFGARGTGKSTLVKSLFPDAHIINLLLARDEERLSRQPDDLEEIPLPPLGDISGDPAGSCAHFNGD